MKKIFVGLILIAALSLACQAVSRIGVPLPAGENFPTPTIPPPSPTPAAALGVPISGGEWQISLLEARTAPSLIMGQTTITPKDNYGLLIVDVALRHLDPTRKMALTLDHFAILDANKTIHTANGGGWSENAMCAGCVFLLSQDPGKNSVSVSAILLASGNISFTSTTLRSGEPVSFVFVLDKEKLDDEWSLQFQDVPPIAFKLGDKASYSIKTEVLPQESYMPQECKAENMKTAREQSGLMYQQWKDRRLDANFLLLDSEAPLELCGGFAYNDWAMDSSGGALLTAGALQGWSNFYLIEPDGKVVSLVRNALSAEGAFILGGRYVVFSVHPLGEEKEQLYLYDRESGKAELLYEGRWINYRVFANGALLAEGMPLNTFDQFAFMGKPGAGELPKLNLPEGAHSGDITDDGEHLLLFKYESGESRLYLSNLDGGEEREIKTDYISYADKLLSPDGKYLLLPQNGTKPNSRRAILYDLAAESAHPVTSDGDMLEFSFSPDGKWAVAVTTLNREEGDKAKTKKQTLSLFDVSGQKAFKEIKGEILNYFFSPDGAFFAYTLLNEDETLDMFVLNLSDGSQRKIGNGILEAWSR